MLRRTIILATALAPHKQLSQRVRRNSLWPSDGADLRGGLDQREDAVWRSQNAARRCAAVLAGAADQECAGSGGCSCLCTATQAVVELLVLQGTESIMCLVVLRRG